MTSEMDHQPAFDAHALPRHHVPPPLIEATSYRETNGMTMNLRSDTASQTPVMERSVKRAFIDIKRVCQEVSILDLAGSAANFRRSGDHWLGHAPDREDSTPSLLVWEPGTGRNPENGWNFYDHGRAQGGGPVEFLMMYEGMSWRDGLEKCGRIMDRTGPVSVERQRHVPSREFRQPVQLHENIQRQACGVLAAALQDTRPLADRWLKEERGLDPIHARALGDLLMVVNQQHCWDLGDRLRTHHHDMMMDAGLLRPPAANDPQQRPRFILWDQAVLLGSRDEKGRLISVRARRTHWNREDPYGKYIAQSHGAGTVSYPFGIRAAQEASAERKPLIILEGGFDAIGARQLGYKAMAMGIRPGFKSADNGHDTVQGRWFREHRNLFSGVSEMLILPDKEQGKNAEIGLQHATELARYLRMLDLPSRPVTMDDLNVGEYKDMSQAADPRHR